MGQTKKEIKSLIVEMYINGHRAKNISSLCNVKLRTVYSILKKFKTTGSTENAKRNRKGKVSKNVVDFIDEFIDKNR